MANPPEATSNLGNRRHDRRKCSGILSTFLCSVVPVHVSAMSPYPSGNETRATLIVGMAGSGKSTVSSCLKARCESKGIRTYTINLDPAVRQLQYEPNIDIRDTIDYEAVRKEYSLGPNGAILTSCNLFATRFDQVVSLCERRQDEIDHLLVDTPGQMEIFTWSAAGTIVCESLATSFATTVLFVVDTPRAKDAQVFVSNMLQCLSVVYKTRLPVVLAFNKIDVVGYEFAKSWMEKEELLRESLDGLSTYSSDLAISLIAAMSKFYTELIPVGISATRLIGIDELLEALDLVQ